MIRREYLTLLGSGIGISSGCIGTPSNSLNSTDVSDGFTESPGNSEPKETAVEDTRRVPIGRSVSLDGTEYRVANPRLSKALISTGVHDPTLRVWAGQYVSVDVRRDGEPPNSLTETTVRPSVNGDIPPKYEPEPSIETGRWGFPFPVRQSERAAILWKTQQANLYWDLPIEMRSALSSEPQFRVKSFEVPRRNGELILDLTVVNEGSRDGMFRAEVSMEAFSGQEIIELFVPTGESRRYTGRAKKILLYFEDSGGGILTVTYPGGGGLTQLERTVDLSD